MSQKPTAGLHITGFFVGNGKIQMLDRREDE